MRKQTVDEASSSSSVLHRKFLQHKAVKQEQDHLSERTIDEREDTLMVSLEDFCP